MKLAGWREPQTEHEREFADIVLEIEGFQPVLFKKVRTLTQAVLMSTEDFKGKFKPMEIRQLRGFMKEVCKGCFVETHAENNPKNERFVEFLGFRFSHSWAGASVYYWSDL